MKIKQGYIVAIKTSPPRYLVSIKPNPRRLGSPFVGRRVKKRKQKAFSSYLLVHTCLSHSLYIGNI